MRVTLDSNVYVSALNFGGLPGDILELAAQNVFQLQLSPLILEETARILKNKFRWPDDDLAEARSALISISQWVVPHLELDILKRDPKDNFILECSQASSSDYLVTGDRDLLEVKQYAGARILSPSNFLRIILEQSEWL